jgi:hypothetical protein
VTGLLAASPIVLGGVLAGPSRLGPRATASGRVALALAAGLLLLHVAHAYVRWFPRSWYFAGWGLVTAMMAGAAATVVGRLTGRDGGPIPKGGAADRPPAPSPARPVVAWVMLAALLAVVGLDLERTVRLGAQPRYGWQRELLLAGLGLADHVPPGEPVGSFNAAIIGYASARTVVNLDGVVNAAAGRSMRQGRLGAYMAERGIRFLVDYPATWGYAHFRYTLGPLMGREFADAPREVVARFDVPGVGWPDPDAAVLLLRIDWRGAPRASP